jgi:hypothetical protein
MIRGLGKNSERESTMGNSDHYTEDDVTEFARVAGTTVSPENTRTIAANLSALRSGVLAKAKTLPDDLGPILTMDPRWGGRK